MNMSALLSVPVIAIAIFATTTCHVQSAKPPGAIRIVCTFNQFASPQKGLKSLENPMTFEFIVHSNTGEAFIIGNLGLSPVKVLTGTKGITFIEQLDSGAVQSTTVSKSTWKAVHSRHTFIFDLFPSQYYGACTARR